MGSAIRMGLTVATGSLRLEALREREQTTSAEYQAVYDHNIQAIYRALAKLANSRSEKQDRRLRKELDDLREDIESLIAKGS